MANELPDQTGRVVMTATSFASSKPRRATRARFSKVRTGCVTCKRRHVKCDETKPCCRNCIKWAGHCSGYEIPGGQSAKTGPKAEEGTQTQSKTQRLAGERASSPTLPAGRSGRRQGVETPPPVIPGTESRPCVLDESFWTETLPQLVRDSDAVRSANLAVHTLMLAKGPGRSGAPTAADDYGRALACYGQALRAARQATGVSNADPREAVLCSLFFSIFEMVNGDRAAAAAHLRSGQRILDDAQAPTQRDSDPRPQRLQSQLRHVVRFLAYQARGAYSCLSASVEMVVHDNGAEPDLL